MSRVPVLKPVFGWMAVMLIAVSAPAGAQERSDTVLDAVVRVTAEIPSTARTAAFLGTEREGSGVVIDGNGLVLTIGYLMLEAMSATVSDHRGRDIPAAVVGYDYDTGFGLLRALAPLGIEPMRLGSSAELDEGAQVLTAAHGGAVLPAYVAARGEFAGYWEYLLDEAVFTVPAHPEWSGAALIDRSGRLVGIGSLIVDHAAINRPDYGNLPGNMFVPIDILKPILGDMLTTGRSGEAPRPWLGIFSRDTEDGVRVINVVPDGPAERAGVATDDIVVAVAGETVGGMPDLYRKLWAQGEAGANIPLTLRRGGREREVLVRSANRYDYLRLDPTY